MRRLSMVFLLVGLLTACVSNGVPDTTAPDATSVPATPRPESTQPPETAATVTPTTSTSTTSPPEGVPVVTLVDRSVSMSPVSGTSGADGRPVIAYVDSDGELVLLRCGDPDCEDPPDQVVLAYTGEALSVDVALLPDGSAAVAVEPVDGEASLLFVCSDPACESVDSSEVGRAGRAAYPSIAIGADGLPRIVYIAASDPMELRLAACQTRTCSQWEWATIDTLPAQSFTGAPSFRIDTRDRAVIGFWHSQGPEAQQSRVAICEDASCAGSPTIFSIDGGVFAQTTPGVNDDEFLVWYQTGSESLPIELITDEAMEEGVSAFPAIWSDYSDIMMATCTTQGCADFQHVEVGEDWLLPQAARLFLLYTAPDGSTRAFFNHASRNEPTPQLHVTACADETCTDGVTNVLGIGNTGVMSIDVIITPGMAPKVVFTSDTGLHLYRCATQSCTPNH